MKSKKLPNLLFALAFVLALFGGLFALVFLPKETVSYYENRNLAQIPEFSFSALWDGSYWDSWSDYVTDHSFDRENLIALHTDLDLNILYRPNVNNIVQAGGKLLPYSTTNAKSTATCEQLAEAMAERYAQLNEQITSYGGTFLYAAVPCQAYYYADLYPWYLSMQGEIYLPDRDALAEQLTKQDVSFLDIGEVFDELGHPDNFFTASDHHYSYYGAFAAYQAILEQINQQSDWNVKIYGEDEIEFQTLPNPFLGSRARQIYSLVETEDQLTIGIFKDAISFRRYDSGEEVAASCYTLPEDDEQQISYTAYMGGDQAETVIQTDRPELPNVLIVGDSFTNALETLLYASFNEMRSLDLRYYDKMSLQEYIDTYKPDVVIYVRDYTVMLSSEGNGNVSS